MLKVKCTEPSLEGSVFLTTYLRIKKSSLFEILDVRIGSLLQLFPEVPVNPESLERYQMCIWQSE
jgi:hypothetical protein